MCVSKEPTWDSFNDDDGNNNSNHLYGTEYQTGSGGFSDFSALHNFEAPCAVYLRTGRTLVTMVPGTQMCPDASSLEYAGYVTSTRYTRRSDGRMITLNVPNRD